MNPQGKRKGKEKRSEQKISASQKLSRTEWFLIVLTFFFPFTVHFLEMAATNPPYYPSFLPTLPVTILHSCFPADPPSPSPSSSPAPTSCTMPNSADPPSSPSSDLFPDISLVLNAAKLKTKEPTPYLLCLRSRISASMLAAVGLFCLCCRLGGRRDPELFIDVLTDFLPNGKALPVVYVFGRIFFQLDDIVIINSWAKALEAMVVIAYLVSFTTVYAGRKSLKKILKLVVVFTCCLSAELIYRFYCWEGVFVAGALPALFLLNLLINLEDRTADVIEGGEKDTVAVEGRQKISVQ